MSGFVKRFLLAACYRKYVTIFYVIFVSRALLSVMVRSVVGWSCAVPTMPVFSTQAMNYIAFEQNTSILLSSFFHFIFVYSCLSLSYSSFILYLTLRRLCNSVCAVARTQAGREKESGSVLCRLKKGFCRTVSVSVVISRASAI